MGAKDWILMYADGEIRPILRAAPPPDRDATRALVERLHPGHDLVPLGDRDLMDANPPDGHVHAGCFPGLTIVCTGDVALDHPSRLGWRFRAEADGRAMYLHAMHSVVDWCAFAVWSADGGLRRSLSLSPRSGICEDIGEPLPFERPYWAGERQDDDEHTDPWRFHPLDLAEDALRHLFGFCYEVGIMDDDPDLEAVTLLAYEVRPRTAARQPAPPGVTMPEIAAHVRAAFPDTRVSLVDGEPPFADHLFSERYAGAPDGSGIDRRQLWATLIRCYDTEDPDGSGRYRPGVFRLSLRLTPGAATVLGPFRRSDPAVPDVLLPHPEPGRLHRGDGWVSVLCPDRTWPQVRELLAVAHDLAVRRVHER